jgi:hypothetical protein
MLYLSMGLTDSLVSIEVADEWMASNLQNCSLRDRISAVRGP